MGSSIYKTVFIIGLISFLHSGYSAAQHRRFGRITEQEEEFSSLPLDIVVQCLVSWLVTMHAVVHIAGAFKEIRVTKQLEKQSWDQLDNRPSFYTFCHRGRSLLQPTPIERLAG